MRGMLEVANLYIDNFLTHANGNNQLKRINVEFLFDEFQLLIFNGQVQKCGV